MSDKLTEDLACGSIMRDLYRRSMVLPRYTPADWWECDVFELTGSGYFREYEVKLTLVDFERDALKTRRYYYPHGSGRPTEEANKHQLLAGGDVRGPVEYWFVAPVGLIPPDRIPPFAGLMELHDRGNYRPSYKWTTVVVKRAPRLHQTKAHAKSAEWLVKNCYYRYHAAAGAIRDREAFPVEWTDERPPEPDATTLSP